MGRETNELIARIVLAATGLVITILIGVTGTLLHRGLDRIEKTQKEISDSQLVISERLSTIEARVWPADKHYSYAEQIQSELGKLDKEITRCCKK